MVSALAALAVKVLAALDLAVVPVAAMAADEVDRAVAVAADRVVMVVDVVVPAVADSMVAAGADLVDRAAVSAGPAVVALAADAEVREVPAAQAVAPMAQLHLVTARDVGVVRSGWPWSATTSPIQR